MIVNLHIERLVIDGLAVGRHEGPAVEAAVAAELTRLIGDTAGPDRFADTGSQRLIRTEPIAQAAGDGAHLGAQIGRAIYGGITR